MKKIIIFIVLITLVFLGGLIGYYYAFSILPQATISLPRKTEVVYPVKAYQNDFLSMFIPNNWNIGEDYVESQDTKMRIKIATWDLNELKEGKDTEALIKGDTETYEKIRQEGICKDAQYFGNNRCAIVIYEDLVFNDNKTGTLFYTKPSPLSDKEPGYGIGAIYIHNNKLIRLDTYFSGITEKEVLNYKKIFNQIAHSVVIY